MQLQSEDILFSNVTYNPEAYYFLYVGDLKNYSLNSFLKETFERRIPNKEIRFIAIVPDVCIQYNYANIIVINPVTHADMISNHTFAKHSQAPQLSCRISSSVFMSSVSDNKTIHHLINTILCHQNQLYINMYESLTEMTLDQIDRVSILGPDKHIAKRYNNKLVQYQELQGVVPLIDGQICQGRAALLETTARLRTKWPEGIFVSAAFSAAGLNSAITHNQKEVQDKFIDPDGEYLVTRYLPHSHDPTVLAVVANENDIYIAGIADQVIVQGNKFVGSMFPATASEEQCKQLRQYTIDVGKVLGQAGYRGIYGCDFLITPTDEIYFLEINARKQGTTLEFCFTLEQTLPEGSPMLPELEYFAVTENRFPGHTQEMKDNLRSIHWATYNHKVSTKKITTGYIPQNPYERETFSKVARKDLLKDFVILEHLGTNLEVMPGTFLARVVSVGRNKNDVNEGICQGTGFIQQTVQDSSKHAKKNSHSHLPDSYTGELSSGPGFHPVKSYCVPGPNKQ